MVRVGRRNKGYIKVYTSLPPGTEANVRADASRRGLDKADVIREALIEKFGLEAMVGEATFGHEASPRTKGVDSRRRTKS